MIYVVALHYLFFQAGIVINTIVERYGFSWRVPVSVQILIGSVLALGALFLHETPRYTRERREIATNAYKCTVSVSMCIITVRFLVKKQKVAKALKVLIKIRQDHTKAQSELSEIQSSVRDPLARSRESWSQTIKYFCSGSILQR